MSTPVEDLFRQASTLDEQDRATLAGLLWKAQNMKSIRMLKPAWRDEIVWRLAELKADGVELVPSEEMQAKIRKSTGAQHTDQDSSAACWPTRWRYSGAQISRRP